MKSICRYITSLVITLSCVIAFAEDRNIVITRSQAETRVSIPSNGSNAPSVVLNQANGGLFLATGMAAQIVSKKSTPTVNSIETSDQNLIPRIKFSDLNFIISSTGQRIAAAYPLNPLIKITTIHALQKASFESINLKRYKIWGFQSSATNEIYDVAFVSPIESVTKIKKTLSDLEISDNMNAEVSLQHLNLVDGPNELILSQSRSKIVAINKDYVFFNNDISTIIGPGSSGAIVYDIKAALPQAVVICSSQIINKGKTNLIRSLKFEALKNATVFELSADLIESFQPRNCDPYDARRGGGD